MPDHLEIRRASDPAELLAAQHLFDGPVRREWSERFLADPGHLMLLAYVEGAPAGFITGIEMLHPDKGSEMCLYELAVDEPYRRRGIASELVATLAAVARDRGCYDMWVPVDADNEVALALYRATGAGTEEAVAVLTWTWD
ncbi:GNAT family N-acetyltransferase [Streptomyces sp. NBC_01465]|uniref:GNAT family N-acetyltransferase n=1 Tax=Streptomyces sp. NBC_01465 TaxID=2903878 RepID=UPI002E312B11|nr:GNAT family N-acetyltransferase [Streptomyces sp. NBC_01465]